MNNLVINNWISLINNLSNNNYNSSIYNYKFVSDKTIYDIPNLINKLIDNNIINKDNNYIITIFIYNFILFKRLSHNIIITSDMLFNISIGLLLISEKLISDETYDNYTWSEYFSISLNLLNSIEILLLKYLNYTIFITKKEFLSNSTLFI
jgi:hypothetical protein